MRPYEAITPPGGVQGEGSFVCRHLLSRPSRFELFLACFISTRSSKATWLYGVKVNSAR